MGNFGQALSQINGIGIAGIALLVAGAAASYIAGHFRKKRESTGADVKKPIVVQLAGLAFAFIGAILIFL